MVMCSECKTENSDDNKYCVECGHKLKKIIKYNKNYCRICGELVDEDDDFCGNCGYAIPKNIEGIRVCPVCGEWNDIENYCWNCGHDFLGNKNHPAYGLSVKRCPHCNTSHDGYFNYCEKCGTKLVFKLRSKIRW